LEDKHKWKLKANPIPLGKSLIAKLKQDKYIMQKSYLCENTDRSKNIVGLNNCSITPINTISSMKYRIKSD